MSRSDFLALSPIAVVGFASMLVMLVIAFRRSHALSVGLTLAGLGGALALLPVAASVAPRNVTPLFVIDAFTLFYLGLILVTGGVVALLSYGYFRHLNCYAEEYYILLLLCTAGAGAMAASRHFASFYLGLEVLSVSLYTMIGYLCTSKRSTEAAVKYLVLAAAAAAFLLFGMALIYAEVGSLEFAPVAEASRSETANGIVTVGFALMLAGLGFKLSIVPFHMWTSDVYEGAPAPVTAYVATVSKGAVFALLLRYFTAVNEESYSSLYLIVSLTAVASMFVGNLLALFQKNVKRMLAYSSIAHLGYVSVAFLAGGAVAVEAVTCYLVAYFITTLGAFGVVTVLTSLQRGREADSLEDYRGLFRTRPALATVFSLMLLSLAGIPLTAGFLGKFYALAAGVQGALWWQTVLLVVNSAIGVFYYLRVIGVMADTVPADTPEAAPSGAERLGHAVLAGLTVAIVLLGVYPGPFLSLLHTLIPVPA